MDDNKIWRKDDFFPVGLNGRIDMDPAVVELPTEPVALVWNYRWEKKPYGSVTNVRLEDGEILGDVELYEENRDAIDAVQDEIRLGGYYTNVIKKGDVVEACKLRAVALILKAPPGFPKDVIEPKSE